MKMKKNCFPMLQAKHVSCFLFVLSCLVFFPALPGSGRAAEQNSSTTFIAHVASFKTETKSGIQAKQIESKGVKAWTKKMNIPGKGLYHRVYVGPFNSRKSAVTVLQKLKSDKVISYYAIEAGDTATEVKGEILPPPQEVKPLPPKTESRPAPPPAATRPAPQPPEKTPVAVKPSDQAAKPAPEPARAEAGKSVETSSVPSSGKTPQTVKQAPQVYPFDPKQDASFYYNQGIKHLIKEQYDLALQSFSNALRIDAKFAEGYIKRGDTWYLKGDNEMAINDYNTAIALKPRYSESYLGRGLAYKNLGQIKKSEEDLRHACRLGSEEACTLLKVWRSMTVPGR